VQIKDNLIRFRVRLPEAALYFGM